MTPMNSDFEKAKACAFWYINRKRYTKKELIERLVKKEYEQSLAEEVINHLEERGYVDDRDYTRRYISDAVKLKGHGKMRIKNDLRAKGISADLVDEVLLSMEIDCNMALPRLLESKAANADLKDEKQRNRIVSFLVRRGFSYKDISDAVREYLLKRENTD